MNTLAEGRIGKPSLDRALRAFGRLCGSSDRRPRSELQQQGFIDVFPPLCRHVTDP
jgi:hypothetical protein